MGLTEASLQLVQLAGSEPSSVTFLLGVLVLDSEEVLVLGLVVLVVNVQPESVALLGPELLTVRTEGVEVWFRFSNLTALI